MTATDQDPAALLEVLHAALDADPSDSATRQAMADLLEDQGDRVAARGQRWQALHGRWPARGGPGRSRADGWRWCPYSGRGRRDDIPPLAFRLLADHYPCRHDAEAGLAQALEEMASRGARREGYDGEPCPWCGVRKQVSSGRERACDGCGRRWEAGAGG